MKTAEEKIDLFYKNIPEEERMYSKVLIAEIAKSYAREACKEQRDICAAHYNHFSGSYDHTAHIENAPLPDLP